MQGNPPKPFHVSHVRKPHADAAEPGARSDSRPAATRMRHDGAPFEQLSIAVIGDRDHLIEPLIRALQKQRAEVRHLWPAPAQYPTPYDVVFSVLLPDLPMRLPWLPGAPESALVVLLPAAGSADLRLLRNCAPHAVLHLPASDSAIEVSLALARDRFGYEQRLSARIDKLDENLRTMRTVERAKAILMTGRGMSEEKAYQFLRKQAMAKRVSIGRLSEALIDSEELLS